MSDAIYTAETGLAAFEAGLQAISNDTSNMNTPGFKGSDVLFADLVGGNGENAGGEGEGVTTLGTAMNFSAGQLQSTGNPLDLAISGNGFFTLRDSNGNIHYTQAGQFEFNSAGVLISSATKEDVMALDKSGNLVPISIAGLKNQPAKPTTTVSFTGNLLSSQTTQTVSNISVIDSSGVTHALTLTLKPSATSGSTGGTTWTATVADTQTPAITLSSPATIEFDASGQPVPGQATLTAEYTPAGATSATTVTLDFSQNVTSSSGGTASLAYASQNGYAAGTLTGETFDGTGTLVLSYTNNQTVNGPQLALANFDSPDDVRSVNSNEFSAKGTGWQVGVAGSGTFGNIESGQIEGSNVDLSQEFSNLVIMQRGYQAASQVISTASDMLSSLFNMVVK